MMALRKLAVALLCVTSISAPAAAQKVLRVVPHAEPRVLDGYVSTAGITAMHMAAVYDTLFAWDETMTARPDAVGDWSVTPDQLKYTFSLRPGLKFHDGSQVTARDAVASVKRALAKETLGRTLAPFVASVDIVDDKTFTLAMKEPFGFTVFSLSGVNQAAGIMREKEASGDPNTPVTEPIGSGPFRFNRDEWKPGTRVVYDKNRDYVPRTEAPSGFAGGKVVKVDRVEYTIIPDAATKYAALQRDEVDFLDGPSLDLISTIDKDPNIAMTRINPLGQFGVLRPNHLHPPFNHPKARQALALMVDQREYAQAAFGEERFWKDGTPCSSFFMCGTTFGTEAGSEPYRRQDLAKARQLMIEAGYKGEKIVVIGASDLTSLKALTLVTAENLKKIGVNVELYMAEWGTVIGRRAKKEAPDQGGWHIFHTTNGGPSQTLPFGNLGTPTICDQAWFGWPCDDQAERLRQQFMRETDPSKQKQIAETLHRRLWEVIPYVPIANYEGPQVYRKNITGLVKGTSVQVWWNIDKS
jgi:peptide/nickel transport system substrate-binding protein